MTEQSTYIQVTSLLFFQSRHIQTIRRISVPGKTNTNYLVHTPEGAYFVKYKSAHSLHVVNPDTEHRAITLAHSVNLGPQLHYHCTDPPVLITTAYPAANLSYETARSPQTIKNIAQATRRFHSLSALDIKYPLLIILSGYCQKLTDSPHLNPDDRSLLHHAFQNVQNSQSDSQPAFCHNDLARVNLIDYKGIKFIDMEMAGLNDLHFDLAAFIVFSNLDPTQEKLFLDAYAVPYNPRRLQDMKLAVYMRDALWGCIELHNNPDETTFQNIKNSNLAKLRTALT